MYMEEIDWCYRIKNATPAPGYTPRSLRFRPGRRKLEHWQIYCLPSATVIHHGGASGKAFREEMFVQLHKSRRYFYQKHYSPRFLAAAKVLTWLGTHYLGLAAHWQAWRGQISPAELSKRIDAYQRSRNLYAN
jgi:GT2 family glycosyltransferase